ncbi:esterase [Afipia sp. P52-10]|nr:esterase [Afipia sp. P52-10]
MPEGFAPSKRSSGYLDLIGPIYEAGEGANYRIGLRIDQRHLNTRGTCHGALFSALADVYLGRIAAMSASPPLALVTAHLGLDYIASAPPGAWLEAVGQVDRVGKTLAHSSGRILADGKLALRCTGVFQLTSRPVPGRNV